MIAIIFAMRRFFFKGVRGIQIVGKSRASLVTHAQAYVHYFLSLRGCFEKFAVENCVSERTPEAEDRCPRRYFETSFGFSRRECWALVVRSTNINVSDSYERLFLIDLQSKNQNVKKRKNCPHADAVHFFVNLHRISNGSVTNSPAISELNIS